MQEKRHQMFKLGQKNAAKRGKVDMDHLNGLAIAAQFLKR
jgi:hypothetical protein